MSWVDSILLPMTALIWQSMDQTCWKGLCLQVWIPSVLEWDCAYLWFCVDSVILSFESWETRSLNLVSNVQYPIYVQHKRFDTTDQLPIGREMPVWSLGNNGISSSWHNGIFKSGEHTTKKEWWSVCTEESRQWTHSVANIFCFFLKLQDIHKYFMFCLALSHIM